MDYWSSGKGIKEYMVYENEIGKSQSEDVSKSEPTSEAVTQVFHSPCQTVG